MPRTVGHPRGISRGALPPPQLHLPGGDRGPADGPSFGLAGGAGWGWARRKLGARRETSGSTRTSFLLGRGSGVGRGPSCARRSGRRSDPGCRTAVPAGPPASAARRRVKFRGRRRSPSPWISPGRRRRIRVSGRAGPRAGAVDETQSRARRPPSPPPPPCRSVAVGSTFRCPQETGSIKVR